MTRRRTRSRARRVDLERYRSFVPDWDAFLEVSARPEPTVLRVRTGRVSPRALVGRLEARGFQLRELEGQPDFFEVLEGPCPPSRTLEYWLGLFYLQQASTGLAAPALGAVPGERVLDLCAAPGGKTTHLADLMQDRGCLVAAEIDERRIRGLLGNVYRLGHTNVMVVSADGRGFPEGALFDHVLVDAPCSGEGTLRRRSGEIPNQSKSFLGYVTAAQRELLRKALRLVRPGGTVLYVTCTFSPEENEAVVSDILSEGDAELEPLGLDVPHAPGLTAWDGHEFDGRLERAARIYPHHLNSGGLFLARLRRPDDASVDPGVGWSDVPASFPDDRAAEHEAAEHEGASRIREALTRLTERYGLPGVVDRYRWMLRGGRCWVHTCDGWPLPTWPEGGWRPISLGLRAIEFDSRGRPRPTNDFLRLAGADVDRCVVDVSAESLEALLDRRPVGIEGTPQGPVALRFRGEVVGRGVGSSSTVSSEIPKARAAELRRVCAAERADASLPG